MNLAESFDSSGAWHLRALRRPVIRDECGNWQPVEIYVSNRSEAMFSHSLCPDCLKRDYKNVAGEG
jgi:hypothetical protein